MTSRADEGGRVACLGYFNWSFVRRSVAKLAPDDSKIFSAAVIEQKSEVADPMKAQRQDMDKEATDKFTGRELHRFISLIGLSAVVSPLEGNAVFIATHESTVGDGHAVGIPREIGQHSLGTQEGSLGIDDPFDLS